MKDFERRTLVEALELAQCRWETGTAANWAKLEKIEYKLRGLLEGDLPDGANRECLECLRTGGGMGPRHNGSARCESGSIASGGKNSHCSCDVCF